MMTDRRDPGLSRRDFLRSAVRAAGAWAGLVVIGCQSPAANRPATLPTVAPPTPIPTLPAASPIAARAAPTGIAPAGGRGGGPAPRDARAFQYLLDQVAFGPRNPGSIGHGECRGYLLEQLGQMADQVETQDFSLTAQGVDLNLSNLIGRFNPAEPNRVLLCAHWDTRPYADQDPRPENRETPILGANDGASGVAALLEIGRVFRDRGIRQGLDLVFFDGEDFGRTTNDMFLGSKYFAQSPLLERANRPFGILLDMVGDADLHIFREGFSDRFAGPVADRVWSAVETLGYQAHFSDQVGYTLWDDHVPLNEAGLPTADLIDFRYPYWHTVEDTADKCAPASLRVVAEVVIQTLDSYWA